MMNDILPWMGFLGALTVLFGFLAVLRYMNYRKTIALAERGLGRPGRKQGKSLLRWGILVTGLGVVLSVGLYVAGYNSGQSYPLHLGPWMLGGFVPLLLGLSLILSHFLIQKE